MINRDPLEPRLRRYLEERDERPPIGFEDRILRLVTKEPNRPLSAPRQLAAATAIALLAVGLAVSVAYLRGHGLAGLGPGPSTEVPALSIGTGGGGNWVVRRGVEQPPGLPTHNVLYHTADGGQAWQSRLNFDGIYDGMSWTANGRTGVVWSFEMTTPCGPRAASCNVPPNYVVTVYSTTDAGLHWTPHTKTFGDFALVDFSGANGWVLSTEGMQGQQQPAARLYQTSDAGASWSPMGQMDSVSRMQVTGGVWGHSFGVGERNFEFADTKHGWLATGSLAKSGDSGLLETTDGGLTWNSVGVTPPVAVAGEEMIVGYPILLANGQALLPVFFGQMTEPNISFNANHDYVYFSSDGGSTWANPQPLETNGIQPTGGEWQNFYLDANHWWFTAINQRSAGEPVPQSGPAVARTTDGGKTWQVFKPKDAPTILQMTFTDADHGWALAITGPNNSNILLRTTDGGAHWHQVQVP